MATAKKKTTKKARKTKKTPAAKATAKAEKNLNKFARKALETQKSMLERQHKLVDRGFEVVTGLQERREDAINKMLERSKYVPEQVADMAEVWTQTNRTIRKSYKRSVDKSYALMTDWVDAVASR